MNMVNLQWYTVTFVSFFRILVMIYLALSIETDKVSRLGQPWPLA